MKTRKGLATLAICVAVLWASRFGPYTCGRLPGFVAETAGSLTSILVSAVLLTTFLFLPVYDLISFMTYRFGWEKSFNPLTVYPGEFPAPGQSPLSQKIKLWLFYPLDIAVVIFFLLPAWMKVAYCG